jgi:hypothetical protein
MPTDFPSRLTVQRSVYDWPDGGSAARPADQPSSGGGGARSEARGARRAEAGVIDGKTAKTNAKRQDSGDYGTRGEDQGRRCRIVTEPPDLLVNLTEMQQEAAASKR